MKTEILLQMDGLAKTSELVFLLAASNLPWELDVAMLRRLEKRIHVDLPALDARVSMFSEFLPPSAPSSMSGPGHGQSTAQAKGAAGASPRDTVPASRMQGLRQQQRPAATNEQGNDPHAAPGIHLATIIDYKLVAEVITIYILIFNIVKNFNVSNFTLFILQTFGFSRSFNTSLQVLIVFIL